MVHQEAVLQVRPATPARQQAFDVLHQVSCLCTRQIPTTHSQSTGNARTRTLHIHPRMSTVDLPAASCRAETTAGQTSSHAHRHAGPADIQNCPCCQFPLSGLVNRYFRAQSFALRCVHASRQEQKMQDTLHSRHAVPTIALPTLAAAGRSKHVSKSYLLQAGADDTSLHGTARRPGRRQSVSVAGGGDSSGTLLQPAFPLLAQQPDPADGEQGAAATDIIAPEVNRALASRAQALLMSIGPVITCIALSSCNPAACIPVASEYAATGTCESDCLLGVTREDWWAVGSVNFRYTVH